jgi:hypothetical protein
VVIVVIMVIIVIIVKVANFDFEQFHNLVVNYLHFNFDLFPFTAAIAATFIIPSTFVFVIAFNTVNFLIRVSFTFVFNQFLIN